MKSGLEGPSFRLMAFKMSLKCFFKQIACNSNHQLFFVVDRDLKKFRLKEDCQLPQKYIFRVRKNLRGLFFKADFFFLLPVLMKVQPEPGVAR
jgi:hypothetical protein